MVDRLYLQYNRLYISKTTVFTPCLYKNKAFISSNLYCISIILYLPAGLKVLLQLLCSADGPLQYVVQLRAPFKKDKKLGNFLRPPPLSRRPFCATFAMKNPVFSDLVLRVYRPNPFRIGIETFFVDILLTSLVQWTTDICIRRI